MKTIDEGVLLPMKLVSTEMLGGNGLTSNGTSQSDKDGSS